jgi:hypothetical protein
MSLVRLTVGCAGADCSVRPRTEAREGGGEDERVFSTNLAAAIREWNATARWQPSLLGWAERHYLRLLPCRRRGAFLARRFQK